MEYPIGTKFKTRHKQPRYCTVTDILKTYNAAGELVQIRYVATHEFMGQTVTDRDVVEATIAMGWTGYSRPGLVDPFKEKAGPGRR